MMHTLSKPMHRIFDDSTLVELRDLYSTGEYTKTSLAQKYQCSVTTICLWIDKNGQARAEKFKSRPLERFCDCGKLNTGHRKCQCCRKKLHTREELENLPRYYSYGSNTKHSNLCDSCFDEAKSKNIQLRGYYILETSFVEYPFTINLFTKEII